MACLLWLELCDFSNIRLRKSDENNKGWNEQTFQEVLPTGNITQWLLCNILSNNKRDVLLSDLIATILNLEVPAVFLILCGDLKYIN
jgi:hypothetical protein